EIANGTIASISSEGEFLSITSNRVKLLGYSEDELEKHFSFKDAVHPDDYDNCVKYLKQAAITKEKQTGLEYRIRHKDGSWRWLTANTAPVFDHNGELISIIAVAWDITEHKETEQKLIDANNKYRLLFDTMQEGVIIVDNNDVIQFINQRCCDIFGYNPEELIGKIGYECLIFEEDRDLIINKNQTRTKRVSDEYEVRGTNTKGELIWLRISGAPLPDEDGKIIGSLGIMTDITESKALKEQLLASQKMEAIGKLAGGIAHDFNNILSIIMGYCEELQEDLPKNSHLREGVEEIVKAGTRAAGLTRQLLTFSRKQIVQPRILNLNELLGNLGNMLGRMIGEKIEIHTVLDASLAAVKADPGQLELIVVNLAINARDAMPSGGVLRIETSNVITSKDYLRIHPEIKPGKYVQLSISDNGVGMDKQTLSRIFEPFFTTKETGSGVGLGLPTVYGIVSQSDGYILVSSEPDKGSCFNILIPVSSETLTKTTPNGQNKGFLGKGEHILIVEDEKALLSYFSKLIKNLGYSVSSSSDSLQALELIRKGLKPDLLITDVVMPKMNGKILSEKVLELNPDQKLLFMSGFTDDPLVLHGVVDQGMPFIQKPFNSKDIAIQIRNLLDTPATQKRAVNIFMLDDEDGIRTLFERACTKRGHNFTGAAILSEALTAMSQTPFDILLVDMHLIGMDGFYALTKIRGAGITTPAIIFSGAVSQEDSAAMKALGVIKAIEKSFDNTPVLVFIEEFVSNQ
ncbi:MAG: PAS domain S-box protein, partial [Candidatus Cloacimonetes bacterium]|nr:PAS domain S-box protein [Candidatus Cloacimonadota bacterium]